MSHIYTDTMPRKPRVATKRGIAATAEHVRRLEERAATDKAALQRAERELRVLRRIRFFEEDQTESVRASLKLINHVTP